MAKIDDAKNFLIEIGMPKEQQSDICCYAFLALSNIQPASDWSTASNEWLRVHDIIQFIRQNYKVEYAENSRETFRKQALHAYRTAALVEDNGRATNSPLYRYRLTNEALNLVQKINAKNWSDVLSYFLKHHEKLIDIYSSKKEMTKMPVKINENDFTFSPGKHNELQKAIIEEFAPRFAPNSGCLYVDDTTEKDLVKNIEKLHELGFEITLHNKMPDIVLYREDKDWIYFVESVTPVGPMDPKRILEISKMTANVASGKIFVTAFLDFKTFKSFWKNLHGKLRSGSLTNPII